MAFIGCDNIASNPTNQMFELLGQKYQINVINSILQSVEFLDYSYLSSVSIKKVKGIFI